MKKVLFSEYENRAYDMVALSQKECTLRILANKWEKFGTVVCKIWVKLDDLYSDATSNGKDNFLLYMAKNTVHYIRARVYYKAADYKVRLAEIRNEISEIAKEDGYEITKF